jgi:preprotein translocase subunit SecD
MRFVGLAIMISLMCVSVADAAQRRSASNTKRTLVASKSKVKPKLAATARVFTIAGEAFSEAEILDARAQPDIDGKATIMITFDDNGRVKLARLSGANKSKPLPFVLDGNTLMAPVVTDPIIDGVAQISGTFTITEAEVIAKKISGKPPLPDSL